MNPKTACTVVRLDWIKDCYPQDASSVQPVVFVCNFKKAEEWEGSPLWHRPPLSFMFHIYRIANTHTHTNSTDTHRRITKNLATALSVCQRLDSPRSLDGLRDTVTLSQDPCRQPWDKKLIIALHTPRWVAGGGVTLWWGGKECRRGNRLEAHRGAGAISTSATAASQTYTKKMYTHAHSGESYSDGQFCHHGLPSCHSDMERLGPYERFCSPKRCLGAGVREMRQSLLMKAHNQMWKLSCTLTGSIVAKSAARCNIDAGFSVGCAKRMGGNWKHISNTW